MGVPSLTLQVGSAKKRKEGWAMLAPQTGCQLSACLGFPLHGFGVWTDSLSTRSAQAMRSTVLVASTPVQGFGGSLAALSSYRRCILEYAKLLTDACHITPWPFLNGTSNSMMTQAEPSAKGLQTCPGHSRLVQTKGHNFCSSFARCDLVSPVSMRNLLHWRSRRMLCHRSSGLLAP